MHTRFVVPVMVATALHALVFVGSERAVRAPITKPRPVTTMIEEVIFAQKEDVTPERMAGDGAEASPAKGNPEVARPTLDEPPPKAPLGEAFEIVAVKLPPSAGVAKIVPGVYGDPNGVGEALAGRPVVDYTMLDNSPRARAQAAPIYPGEARRQGRSGEVLVEFVVDEEGRVLNPRVVRSSDAVFESATLNAVSKWRFEPGRKGGKPVRFRMAAPVRFGLDA